jgi:hypothetical protein
MTFTTLLSWTLILNRWEIQRTLLLSADLDRH